MIKNFLIIIALAVVLFLGASNVSQAEQFTTDLFLGSTGSEVIKLQALLESKGFLVIPNSIPRGYFGQLTKNAVAKYQISQGISPALGYFGPTTRTKVNSSNTPNDFLGTCIIPAYSQQDSTELVWNDNNVLGIFSISFKNGSDVRLRDGVFVSLCGADVGAVNQLMRTYGLVAERLWNSMSEETADKIYRSALANNPKVEDPNLSYLIKLIDNTDAEKIERIANEFKALPLFEYVLPNPKPVLPPCSQGAECF